MLQLLKRIQKKHKEQTMHIYSNIKNNDCEIPPQPINHLDNKTVKLIELICAAIKEWAIEYHLENVPKKIIFEQALDAMRSIELTINNNLH